jgi:hypothetical protein
MEASAEIIRDQKTAKQDDQQKDDDPYTPKIEIIIIQEKGLEVPSEDALREVEHPDKDINGEPDRQEDRETGKEIFLETIGHSELQ